MRIFSAALSVALLGVLLTACDDGDDMRADTILCEEAVAHVTSCCGYALPASCGYRLSVPGLYCDNPDDSTSCDDKEHLPDLFASESRCVIHASCSAISPLCKRPLRDIAAGCS